MRDELARAIIGQQAVVQEILTAFFAGGHVLLRGVPGLAKTLLIQTIAQAVDLQFSRIQFTPDLMPSDITGTELLEENHGTGKREFKFQKGPIFASIVLADEINRAPPKTQAALLEAMQEHRVTAAGKTYQLPEPFFVLATQNPIEHDGTYSLPEAQLDRFMFELTVGYPTKQEEELIVSSTTGAHRCAPATSECRIRSSRRCSPQTASSGSGRDGPVNLPLASRSPRKARTNTASTPILERTRASTCDTASGSVSSL